jgi:hypothetical protein
VALLDGSVRQLAPCISPTTFWAAVTPAGGEVLDSDSGVVSRDVVGTAAPIIHVALRVPVTSTSGCSEAVMKCAADYRVNCFDRFASSSFVFHQEDPSRSGIIAFRSVVLANPRGRR